MIKDVYDGYLYRKFSGNAEVLDEEHNISFTFNTDGVPLFKSSRFSMWPLYFVINKLPPSKRFQEENMVLAGMWFSESKPVMFTYLKPFYTSLKELETSGCEVQIPGEESAVTCKAILFMNTCDLPAKAMVCNSMQFNGAYGCSKCLQRGQTEKTDKGGHVHVFPFQKENPKGPPRTCQLVLQNTREVMERKMQHINGIKGPSWLALLTHFDIVDGTSVDYMHCVLEGVVKLLLNLWFSRIFAGKPYNISRDVGLVDKRLEQLQPTCNISRRPRSIQAHLKYWTASELRSFLFFYGPIVLKDTLPEAYYKHFIFLSEAIFLLSMEHITTEQINHAERLLYHFCLIFASLYALRYCTANVHSLLHLPDDVRNLGPLWTHSCFAFENLNGRLLKRFHGSQSITFQIITAVSMVQSMPRLAKQLTPGSAAELFYKKLSKPYHSKKENKICADTWVLGKNQQLEVNQFQELFLPLCSFLGHPPEANTINVFKRIRVKNQTFHSKLYRRQTNRNSSTVVFKGSDPESRTLYGQVEFYFQYKRQCNRQTENCIEVYCCPVHNLALIRIFEPAASKLVHDACTFASAPHIGIFHKPIGDNFCVVPISSLVGLVVYMICTDLPNLVFTARSPNGIKSD